MYPAYSLGVKYIQYWLTAANGKGHGIHSPFVFDFITHVLNDKNQYAEYDLVENLRSQLLKNKTLLTVEDLGAGSAIHNANQRSVAAIARHAAKSRKFGQLLFRIARYYKPSTLLELGTSLGISSAYLSLANPESTIFTIEGAASVAAEAKRNFEFLGLKNIKPIQDSFDRALPQLLQKLPSIDLAFIDGNHRYQPTIQYFQRLVSKTTDYSIIILDDIHWSSEMEEAWHYCKNHETVTLSIDLFFIGILFFRKGILEKQHFTIRF